MKKSITKRAARVALAGALCMAGGIAGASLVGAPTAVQTDAAAVGPQVGTRLAMANGKLRDASGKPTTMAAIAGGQPMMVVMFRSAKWCPYCQRQLIELGPVAAAAKAKGVRFAAISYDEPGTLKTFGAKHNLAFPLYSDQGGRMFAALKLRDASYEEGSFAYGVPYPTILLTDAAGVVKAKSIELDYKQRPSQAQIIAMLDRV